MAAIDEGLAAIERMMPTREAEVGYASPVS